LKTIPIEEFLTILKSLVLKLGDATNLSISLFNLFLQIFHLIHLLNEKSNQITLDDFRQALLNNDLNINNTIDLIICAF